MKRGRFFIAVVMAAVFLAAGWLLRDRLQDLTVDDTRFADQINAAAKRYNLDPQLVRAVIFQESRFDPKARGKAGEVGLMQVLPTGAVAEWVRLSGNPIPRLEELTIPERNLDIGCWYLAQGMRRYADCDGTIELSLARYNAGQSRADKWKATKEGGSVIEQITIPSTKQYVTKIMHRYRKYMEQNTESARAETPAKGAI